MLKETGPYSDERGQVRNLCQWEDTHRSFWRDLGGVKQGGKWGYIDTWGNLKIPYQWDWAGSFTDNLAPVMSGSKWGCIDENGTLVIPCIWDEIGYFSDGLAPAKTGEKWGLIDRNGNTVVPPQWQRISDFYPVLGNYAVVMHNDLCGMINRRGEIVIPCRWEYIGYYYDKRWIMVCDNCNGPKRFWLWHHYDLKTGQMLESMNNDEDGYGNDLIDIL